MSEPLAIDAHNLVKQFGDFTAANKVSLKLPYGQIFGLLGANGAGKSTTLRMLSGILAPTTGSAKIVGRDLASQAEEIKKHIGYVCQRFSLYEDLTVGENLEFFASAYGLRWLEKQKRIDELLVKTQLKSYENRLAKDLSGGWKQRLAIAAALLHQPKLVFLDEPTAGLDPLVRRLVWQLLYDLTSEGISLFVTTHYMEEAEKCHKLAIMSHGKIKIQGAPSEVRASLQQGVLSISCKPLLLASKLFATLDGVTGVTLFSHHLNLTLGEGFQKKSVIELAKKSQITISRMELVLPTLEDVFASLEKEGGYE